jgi:hypothetical protein
MPVWAVSVCPKPARGNSKSLLARKRISRKLRIANIAAHLAFGLSRRIFVGSSHAAIEYIEFG